MIRLRFPRLAQYLARHIVPRREPDRRIGVDKDGKNPYMLRWFLIPRNPVFNIYLHNVMRSDDDRALHDHPAWSVSLMLSGRLAEIYRPDHRKPKEKSRAIAAGDVIFRSARFSHRLIVIPGTLGAVTLFISGPKLREWGFWCKSGWRHWREFTVGKRGESIGKGCD
jgi:hypothetical protein